MNFYLFKFENYMGSWEIEYVGICVFMGRWREARVLGRWIRLLLVWRGLFFVYVLFIFVVYRVNNRI